MPSLRERAERAFRPGASQADVDSFLAGLAPDAPRDLSAREFADLLLRIIRDPQWSSLRDRDGRPARHIAAEALQALGPPYAQELPAGALSSRQLSAAVDRRVLIGLLLLAAVAVVEWLALSGATALPPFFREGVLWNSPVVHRLHDDLSPRARWSPLPFSWLVSLVPMVFSLWAWRARRGELLQLAASLLWLGGAARLLLFIIDWLGPISPAYPVFLFTGPVTVLAGFLFRPVWESYRRKFSR
jgi:hypothetical protein